jgi:hypothetical protein
VAGPEGAFWFRRASRKQQRKIWVTLSGSLSHARVPGNIERFRHSNTDALRPLLAEQDVTHYTVADPAFASETSGPMGKLHG